MHIIKNQWPDSISHSQYPTLKKWVLILMKIVLKCLAIIYYSAKKLWFFVILLNFTINSSKKCLYSRHHTYLRIFILESFQKRLQQFCSIVNSLCIFPNDPNHWCSEKKPKPNIPQSNIPAPLFFSWMTKFPLHEQMVNVHLDLSSMEAALAC